MAITHSLFLDNNVKTVIDVVDCDLTITQNTFMNNRGFVIAASNIFNLLTVTMTIGQSVFIDNGKILQLQQYNKMTITIIKYNCEFYGKFAVLNIDGGLLTRIAHCKFTNNSRTVITVLFPDELSVNHNEFINNSLRADYGLINIYDSGVHNRHIYH